MREAACWLIDAGKPMWDEEDLQLLSEPPESFVVLWDGDDSVAAMTLSFDWIRKNGAKSTLPCLK